MPAKVCPRCGEQYEHLHSTTCPQCFAKLVTVDDATAEAFAEARAEVVQTPEFQAAKRADDERFRYQSFGACLGVLAIFLFTAVISTAFIIHAAHEKSSRAAVSPRAVLPPFSDTSLPALPVAAATLDDVFPPTVGVFHRLASDQAINIPGTLTSIFHARYGPASPPIDIYAVPADRPTSEMNAFRLGLAMSARTGAHPVTVTFFATEHWQCATLGGPTSRMQSLQAQYIAHFAARSR